MRRPLYIIRTCKKEKKTGLKMRNALLTVNSKLREPKIARAAAALGDVFIHICLIHERKISANSDKMYMYRTNLRGGK